jgi:hypothetical protein
MDEENKYLIEKTKRYRSFLKEYRASGKIDEITEIFIANMPLEDLIAIKLELTTRSLRAPLFGILSWGQINRIVRDAVVKTAISITQTPSEGAALLGMSLDNFTKVIKKFYIYRYVIDNVSIRRKELRNGKGKFLTPV